MRPLAGGGSCPPYFDPSPLRRYALLRYGGLSLMEPRIQYAKTKDGVSIAFWTLGEGMPGGAVVRRRMALIECISKGP